MMDESMNESVCYSGYAGAGLFQALLGERYVDRHLNENKLK